MDNRVMNRSNYGFFSAFRARYSEIDAQGVVFNAHYLTFFDSALNDYFREMGFQYIEEARKTGFDFHVVKTLVEYKKPIEFDQEFEVGVKTARIGTSSLTFDLAMFLKDEDTLLATGEVVWVYTDQSTGKTAPVRPDLIEMIRKTDP